ncbi:hypothetical protein CH63R_11248 [Colletotrichum higginsianum IMI 349063]|uniref:Uncharacterized protein n=1 Tax=Colletotrichum higginsianum (strain IMI 349063) TaxID=759273 RepID=A0A1B7XXR8_COLHI|nr:hypothetical protein CH63R_11248 [Colletotrichum higginsianum IMI 349063]OBR04545.1 hypothetical protein CH63R_11248 [Colletotrichum higginsianum IMI 349063]
MQYGLGKGERLTRQSSKTDETGSMWLDVRPPVVRREKKKREGERDIDGPLSLSLRCERQEQSGGRDSDQWPDLAVLVLGGEDEGEGSWVAAVAVGDDVGADATEEMEELVEVELGDPGSRGGCW